MEKEIIEKTNINRRNFLQKLGIATSGLVFAAIVTPTEAIAPPTIKHQDNTKHSILESLPNEEALFDYLIQQNLVKSYDIIQYLSEQAPLLNPSLSEQIIQTHDLYALVSIIDTLRATHYRQLDSSLTQPDKDLVLRYAQVLTEYMQDSHAKHIRVFEPEANDIILERDMKRKSHKLPVNKDSNESDKTVYEPFDEAGYRDNGAYKLHRNHTTSKLYAHNIKLESTKLFGSEQGNIDGRGYTCAEGVKQTTVDGIIALKQHLDTLYGDTATWVITGLAETKDHALGITKPSHGGGDKVDISRIGIPALALHHFIDHHTNQQGHTYHVDIQKYHYAIEFHSTNHTGFHFDIEISANEHTSSTPLI